MKIREIEIADFRKLRHARISGLTDGANVIAGENEAGKSTVLAALQAGLFQRHNVTGKVLSAMQPYGCSVRPSINISFELEDGLYRLRKTFGGSGAAELVFPDGRRFANHDADHELEQLLRFRAAARGATDFSSLGIWPLFWIEQGTTFQGLNINPDVRATVQSSLTKEVGDVLIGEAGERLRRRVEQVHVGYFTKTGLETGALAASRKAVTLAESKLTEARQELAAFSADVAKLEAALARRACLIKPELRNELESELKNAQEAARVLSDLDRQIAQAESQGQSANAAYTKAQLAHEQRVELIAKISELAERKRALEDTCARLKQGLDEAEAETKAAAERAIEGDRVVEESKRYFQNAEDILRFITTADLSAVAENRLTKARDIAAQIIAAEEEMARCEITDANIKALRSTELSLVECRAGLEAAAPRVEFEFADASTVLVDGQPLGDRRTILAVEPLDIRVQGGQVRITPAGGELMDRRQAQIRLENQLARELAHVGADSIDAALTIVERRRIAESERKSLVAVGQELAPLGIDALERECTRLRIRTESAAEKCKGLQVPSLSQAEEDCASAKLVASRAEVSAGQLRVQLDGRRKQESDARVSLTAASTELNAVTRELTTLTERLSVDRARIADDAIERDLASAAHLEQVAGTLLASLKDERTHLDPEATEVRLKNSEAALKRLTEQIVAVEREISGLEGRLDGLGEKGLGETCAALESEFALARVRLQTVEQEANAIRVLHKTLLSAEQDANEVFLQPVVRRVQPYLNRVLPGARIELGADLNVEGLRRGGTIEPFFALSVGVREQLSVITRVSFADMLADEGVHAPIILDDALVYADEQRFASTLTTLGVAANRHQIIILTCHEDRYIRLGCPIGRIDYAESGVSA
jgi:uncharacterized protein YhaN